MKCPWYVFIPMTWLEVFSLSLYYLVLVLPAWQGPTSSKPKPRRAHTWGRQWGGRSPALLHADLLSRSPRPSRAALGRAGLREAEAAHGHRGDLRSPGRVVHGGARLPHAPALPRRPGPAQGLPGSTAARPQARRGRPLGAACALPPGWGGTGRLSLPARRLRPRGETRRGPAASRPCSSPPQPGASPRPGPLASHRPSPAAPRGPRPAPGPPPPRSATARRPRAPAAAPPPHLLELIVGGPGRHAQDVVQLRVGHVRHGGSGRQARAGAGRGAARARPGAGRTPLRRHAQTPLRHHAATREKPAPLRPSASRPRPLGPLRAPDPVPARGCGRRCGRGSSRCCSRRPRAVGGKRLWGTTGRAAPLRATGALERSVWKPSLSFPRVVPKPDVVVPVHPPLHRLLCLAPEARLWGHLVLSDLKHQPIFLQGVLLRLQLL